MATDNIHRIPHSIAVPLGHTQQLLSREMGEVLNGLAALECLTDSAKNGADVATVADALDFVTQHIYGHASTVNDCADNIRSALLGAK